MKKITALLVALALSASTAFAAPISIAASLPEPAQTVASSADLDALFADVNAAALTEEEATAVEGEGLFGNIFACITAAVTTATAIVDLVQGNTNAAAEHLAGGMALAGGLLFIPF